jgi:cob(I)alamin adenosyltransferase
MVSIHHSQKGVIGELASQSRLLSLPSKDQLFIRKEYGVNKQAKTKKGLVIVNTGNGKGKTTAALGLVMRSWGREMRVGMLQFIKSHGARFGEIRAAEKMGVELIPLGNGRVTRGNKSEEDIRVARQAWEEAKKRIISGVYNLLVLDEFTYPLIFKWLKEDEVIEWLKENKPPSLHLVITGRHAPKSLIAFADLVTEMTLVKHPYNEQGIMAQPGIEY